MTKTKSTEVEREFKISDCEKAKVFVETVLAKMEYEKAIVETSEDDETIRLEIVAVGKGNLIGYRGELLDALQYLTTVVVGRDRREVKRICLDTEDYRKKREETLTNLALNLEKKVKRTGKATKLEPMNAYERRVIHTALQNSTVVSTESQGEGSHRHVVVSPRLLNDILNAPSRKTSLNFVYRSDKKKRR